MMPTEPSSKRWVIVLGCCLLTVLLSVACFQRSEPNAMLRSFAIENDKFMKDGKPFQLISGSIHYNRIHPEYWRDRLLRVKSMGLNAIQLYVPWNLHEPKPGEYTWEGFANLEEFLGIAKELNLLVLLRPGPYICGEWDFGGMPWWFASSKEGREMRLRSSDPAFLAHVDRWWAELLPRMAPLLYTNGGPIILVQMENEYGFCGSDKVYLRHLISSARAILGNEVILFTTDPPANVEKGSLPGDEIFTVVDFGFGWATPDWAFAAQRAWNAPGKSAPFCSEFYTGWLSHWGEPVANTSAGHLGAGLSTILEYGNGTGSVNLYMAHGGTNFGWWAGANIGPGYLPHITSYDYDCPISEAGSTGQPGIGGGNKYSIIRDVISKHTGLTPPPKPSPPKIFAYGKVHLTEESSLLESMTPLVPHGAILATQPDIMEAYGQRSGLIVYRHVLEEAALLQNGQNILNITAPVHDYAKVLLNGRLIGHFDRDQGVTLEFTAKSADGLEHSHEGGEGTLDIVVEAMGRSNFGCDWDFKGLQNGNVTLNGDLLLGWQVFPITFEDLSAVPWKPIDGIPSTSEIENSTGLSIKSSSEEGLGVGASRIDAVPLSATARLLLDRKKHRSHHHHQRHHHQDHHTPKLFRGQFDADKSLLAMIPGGTSHLPDTFLSTPGFSKGVAFINGFNLGWYWPVKGPQQTLYIPGPLLQSHNELVLLEMEGAPSHLSVDLVAEPDFHSKGPADVWTPRRPNFTEQG